MARNEVNWSLLALLRMVLATIIAGGHLVWLKDDSFTAGLASLGGKAAVAGFLVVSGFSIAASLDRDETGFYFRRFKRIYPMYFCAVASAIVLEIWLGTYNLPSYTIEARGPLTAIGNLLMLQTFLVKSIAFNGVVWSLAVECAFYVISPHLRRLSMLAWTALISVSALFFILPHKFDGGILYALALKANVVKYFWPFAMGFLLYRIPSKAFAVFLCLAGTTLVWVSEINPERFAAFTFACSIATAAISRTVFFGQSKVMDYLGDLSYPLYLIQLPTFILVYRLFGATDPLVLLAAALVATVIAYEIIDVRVKRFIFGDSRSFAEFLGFKRLRIDESAS